MAGCVADSTCAAQAVRKRCHQVTSLLPTMSNDIPGFSSRIIEVVCGSYPENVGVKPNIEYCQMRGVYNNIM